MFWGSITAKIHSQKRHLPVVGFDRRAVSLDNSEKPQFLNFTSTLLFFKVQRRRTDEDHECRNTNVPWDEREEQSNDSEIPFKYEKLYKAFTIWCGVGRRILLRLWFNDITRPFTPLFTSK